MSAVDIVILVLLAFGALLGFKRGFTRELVSLVGIFAIIILSFLFKNPVSVFLYNNLPFFNFGGIFKDITVINILVYEVIAFFLVFIVLSILFKILLTLTKLFEKILNFTIILGIPSKILGAILGCIHSLIYIFIALYILKMPMFNFNILSESKVSNTILEKTPFLKNICDDTLDIFNEVVELKEEYENTDDVKEYNKKVLKLMIDKKIISKGNAINLINKNKIKDLTIKDVEEM